MDYLSSHFASKQTIFCISHKLIFSAFIYIPFNECPVVTYVTDRTSNFKSENDICLKVVIKFVWVDG